METMEIYTWWGGRNPPPDNLKTRKQLSDLNLAPVAHVAIVKTQKYDLKLYDINNPASVRPKREPTEKQLAALEKAREAQYKKRWGFLERDRQRAIAWAREMLENREAIAILDTETTGLAGEVIEIAIIDGLGNPVLDTLIRPSRDFEIHEEAMAIHGITPDMVENAPTLGEIWGEVEKAIAGKTLIIYNAAFDVAQLEFSLHEKLDFGAVCLLKDAVCLMKQSAPYFGEWSERHKSYRWQPLGGNHRAMGDCIAALELLEEMGRV